MHYDDQRDQYLTSKKSTCEEIEKSKLFNQFKDEAKTALETFGFYRWQHNNTSDLEPKPSLDDAINFIEYHESGGKFTLNSLLKEIFRQCDGKNNGNAKLITIEYMSEHIAYWETEAYLNK